MEQIPQFYFSIEFHSSGFPCFSSLALEVLAALPQHPLSGQRLSHLQEIDAFRNMGMT